MKIPRNLYVAFMILGTVAPWLFFGRWLATEGVRGSHFIGSVFANEASSGFAVDLLISVTVFLIWSYADARTWRVQKWWVCIPAIFTVGLSLALPLYLYLRSGARDS